MTVDNVNLIIEKLHKKWPNPKLELEYKNSFQLLVATILAAQCSDARVNAVTKTFFKAYPKPEKIAQEKIDVIAQMIKSTGFYRNKAMSIVACCQRLVNDHKGKVPDNLEDLEKLPGVGRKTANIVLSHAFDKPTIAVDTHVKRVSNRIGLSGSAKSEEIEKKLMKLIDQDKWVLFTNLAVLLGRYICHSRSPKCTNCPIKDLCTWDQKTN